MTIRTEFVYGKQNRTYLFLILDWLTYQNEVLTDGYDETITNGDKRLKEIVLRLASDPQTDTKRRYRTFNTTNLSPSNK